MNPTGLQGKELLLNELGHGIFGVTETHLSTFGIQKVRQSLNFARSPLTHLIHGHPALLRAHSQMVGKHEGVAFLTSYPGRALPQSFPAPVWQTARIQVAGFCVEDVWVQGGIIYGYASQLNGTAPKILTDQLADYAIQRIALEAIGPRFIMGDFNALADDLLCLQHLRSLGFRELQEVAAARWGHEVQMTCKDRTQPDLIFLSPELQHCLVGIEIVPDLFADHAVVTGIFRGMRSQIPRSYWRTPVPPPRQQELGKQPLDCAQGSGLVGTNPSEWYKAIFAQFETVLQHQTALAHQEPLQPIHLGRATTDQVQVRSAQIPPVRKGRAGEVAPEFFGPSRLHAQWFRQLRRLQAYYRLVGREVMTVHQIHQQSELWCAIRCAAGFGLGFAHWWSLHGIGLEGAPAAVPLAPPGYEIAYAFFDSFRTRVRSLEQQLKSTRIRTAHQRRVEDPSLIFRDLKEERASSVEILIQAVSSKVEEVDFVDSAVILQEDTTFQINAPVVIAGRSREVIHTTPDKLWLEDVTGVTPGATVRQETATGDLPSLFRAFGREWERWWHRNADDGPGRWQRVQDEILPLLPRALMQLEPITLAQWRQAVQSKKKCSATGPDGISRLDLLQMPDGLTQELIDLCHYAEDRGHWPQQALVGIITALAKVPGATKVQQFRPITVLSMVYRVWSTIRARQALGHLGHLASPQVIGNLPGKTAGQVWFALQRRLEQAQIYDRPVVGLVADLVKAFNVLPRLPTWMICNELGLAVGLIRAWAGAVIPLQRHFRVRGSVGPPVVGCNGFPEGDPLSCVAMAAVAISFDCWMSTQVPMVTPVSYVDNWEITATSPRALQMALVEFRDFTEIMALEVDWNKTYVWATHGHQRQQLKQLHLPLQHWAKDLGGCVFYGRRHTTGLQAVRFEAMAPLWGRLRVSCAPFAQKLRAVRTAAWPRALHACASVRILEQQFVTLRAGAVRGLNLDKPGTNSLLLLSMHFHPVHDPEFFAFWHTLLDFRRLQNEQDVQIDLQWILTQQEGKFPPGPLWVFFMGCLRIQWSWDVSQGLLLDRIGAFSLWRISLKELEFRAVYAWQTMVGTLCQSRRGFAGMGLADAQLSQGCHLPLTDVQRGLLRTAHDGTFFTQDGLKYSSTDGDDKCLHCGEQDSIEHRIWHCSTFAHVRDQLAHLRPSHVESLPECTRLHCWIQAPPAQLTFFQLLDSIPDASHQLETPVGGGELDLFTDGSCLFPQFPRMRFAAWAVLQGSMATDDGWSDCLAGGALHGLWRTSGRAELVAVLAAIRIGIRSGRRTRIWSDCDNVVKKVKLLLATPLPGRSNAHDADLWEQIGTELGRDHDITIHKVAAHVGSSVAGPVEDWARGLNDQADMQAKHFNYARPPEFWQVWTRLLSQLQEAEAVSNYVVQLHCNIGEESLRLRPREGGPQMRQVVLEARLPLAQCVQCSQETSMPHALLSVFGSHQAHRLWKWFQTVCTGHVWGSWVSPAQLYVDYQMAFGMVGPYFHSATRRWSDPNLPGLERLRGHEFPVQVKWFSKALRLMLQHLQAPRLFRLQWPGSAILSHWCQCLPVAWSPVRRDIIDEWFQRQLPGGSTRRRAAGMTCLPAAGSDPRLAIEVDDRQRSMLLSWRSA